MADSRKESRASAGHPKENLRTTTSDGRLQTGSKVDRFTLISRVGRSRRSRVYEAYDPKLDRKVALKLFPHGGSERLRDRLLQDLQSLGRLDHPNIVRVHDAGEHGNSVFVAMEFVQGETFGEWLETTPRTTPRFDSRAKRLLAEVGRGLQTAHEAGVAHGNLDPSSILIAPDGRARLTAFALGGDSAREGGTQPAAAIRGASSASTLVERDNISADQTSFVQLIYGALRGHASLDDTSNERGPEPLLEPVLDAVLRQRPSHDSLAAAPRVLELVEALEESARPTTERSKGSRRLVLSFGGVLLAAASAYYIAGRSAEACQAEAATALHAHWNQDRRQSLSRSAQNSGFEWGPQAWTYLENHVDAYATEWSQEHADTCEATHVRAEQGQRRGEERQACLDDAMRLLDAKLDLVDSGAIRSLARAEQLIQTLPKVHGCSRSRGVPAQTEHRLLESVARAAALRDGGLAGAATEVMDSVVENMGHVTPFVRARIMLEHGRDLTETSTPQLAIRALVDGYSTAQSAGNSALAGSIALELSQLHAEVLADAANARRWLSLATSSNTTLSHYDRYRLNLVEATLSTLEGKRDEALEAFERNVIALASEPSLQAHARRRLAQELSRHLLADRAADAARDALRAHERIFGSGHPARAEFEVTVANTQLDIAHEDLNEEEAARRIHETAAEALLRMESLWGPAHPQALPYQIELAAVRCRLRMGGGLELARQSVQQSEEASTATHTSALRTFCECAAEDGHTQFVPEAEAWVALSRERLGEEHVATALATARLVEALARAPHPANANLPRQASIAKTLTDGPLAGGDEQQLALVHEILASVFPKAAGRKEAVEHARRSLQLLRSSGTTPARREARARRVLCHALVSARQPEDGLVECLRALRLASRGASPRLRGLIEASVGRTMARLGRDADAVPHTQEALGLLRDRAASFLVAHTHAELAGMHERLAHYPEAETHFRSALELLSENDSPTPRILAGLGLARMAAQQGRVREAWSEVEQMTKLSRETNPFQHAPLLETRAYIRNIENPKAGAREYQEALDIYMTIGSIVPATRLCKASPFRHVECDQLTSVASLASEQE